jgi:hypothetical protein
MKVSSSPGFRFFIRWPVLLLAFVVAVLAVASPASAHVRAHERHHYLVQRESHYGQPSSVAVRHEPESERVSGYHPSGTVTVSTAAGPITVASEAADKFVGLVNDLVAHGFHGSVNCAATGHMPNSLHHTGRACDFAQTARNRTVGIMYSASAIIAAHGLRDGCSFGDCGHVDTGTPLEGHRFAAASSRHQTEPVAYQNRGEQHETRRVAYQDRGGQSGAASWYGGSRMTATVHAPQQESYVSTAARETGRAVFMRWPERGAALRERFLEVSGGTTRTFDVAHHALVRRHVDRM